MVTAKLSTSNQRHEDQRIAVVGMAVKYAGCHDLDSFWNTIQGKNMNSKSISDKRLGSDYRSEHFKPERSKYSDTFCNERYGCIDEAVESEHQLLFDLASSAIKDAKGKIDFARTGIVSGCLSFPMDNLQGDLLNMYQCHIEKKLGANAFADARDWSERKTDGPSDKKTYYDPASYVADKMNLGPLHYSLDAACASALYVLRLAQDHLLSGAADTMLCGASCLPEPFFILSGFSTFHAMPLSGNVSAPLHKHSQGLTPGEGGAIMVLKRLEDAIRDGDRIYGTLLSVELSNAGCGLPLKPHGPSEYSTMVGALNRAHRLPQSIQYVECHATGTPQGDVVEIESMEECFGEHLPLFGSTKGNFGHTLVAAGFAGMCKILLSMKHGEIPPTPGLQNAADIMHPNVVTETIPWPNTNGDLKRACLSAFGFGGTNAHAVFEEYNAAVSNKIAAMPNRAEQICGVPINSKTAIVGMEAAFGTLKNLQEFEHAIYNGLDAARDLPANRWRFLGKDEDFLRACGLTETPRGCYIGDVDVDFKRLVLPMLQEDILRPLQLLAVTTIDKALRDSGLERGSKVAVLVGLGTDLELYRHRARVALKERLQTCIKEDQPLIEKLMNYVNDRGTSTSYTSYIGNLVATRVSSLWGFTGPSFTVTEGENSVYRCMELGRWFLANHEVDAVVVAGVDLCGSAENLFVKSRRSAVSKQRAPCANFDSKADGYFAGDGCGAMVMKRVSDVKEGERIYATVDSVAVSDHVGTAMKHALQNACIAPEDVEMAELSASSERHHDGNVTCESEVGDLSQLFASSSRHRVAIGSVKTIVGDVGYASGAASMIKTALSLFNRYLPVLPNWTAPAGGLHWADSFFVCEHSRAWLKNNGQRRHAVVSGVSESGSCYAVVMSDVEGSHEKQNVLSLDRNEPKVLIVDGDSSDEILAKLQGYLNSLLQETGTATTKKAASPQNTEDAVFSRMLCETERPEKPYALALVTTPAKLQRELELALKGIPRSVNAKRDWCSPSGSIFAFRPVKSDKISFMYGEGRSPYAGLGYDLHRIWPQLHELVNARTTELWDQGDSWFMPRSSSVVEHDQVFSAFDKNQIEMFRLGVFVSMCFTDMATQLLGLKPRAAFGLSLGEVSMLFAFSKTNTKLSKEMTRRLKEAKVWSSQLAVEFTAIRELWGISADRPIDEVWQGYFVAANRSQVERAIGDNKFVRLLIVNDSSSCLIAGMPNECDKIIKKLDLKLPAVPITQGMIGHCEEAIPYLNQISYIHEMLEIPKTPGTTLYTTCGDRKLDASKDSVERLVAEIYQHVADFPNIVNAVHKSEGIDVFVELGSNSFRSAAVKSILGPEVVSVALDRQNESAWTQMMKMVAVLVSNRVPGVHPFKLYHSSLLEDISEVKPNKFLRAIELNGFFNPEDIKLNRSVPNTSTQVIDTIKNRKMNESWVYTKTTCSISMDTRQQQAVVAASPVLASSPVVIQQQDVTWQSWDAKKLQQHLEDLDSVVGGVQPLTESMLGDKGFLETYGVKYPLYTGAMAKGIASAELVIAAGKENILASFGAGGLPLSTVEDAIRQIQGALGSKPFAVNLIHSPFDPHLETGNVDLFVKYGVHIVEASAFMSLTPQVVRYRALGLSRGSNGTVIIANRLIAKVSRTEVAQMFLSPAPRKILDKLVEEGAISSEQAELATLVPMADDICVEADSGGHTDNRPIHVLLPLIIKLRNKTCKQYPKDLRVRIGAAGGIGCPQAAVAAFELGAAFVATGTVNQISMEAGTCDYVRKVLANATYSDVTMAPAADMFDQGVELQVLKKGTMFPARARKLYELFVKYDSLQSIPADELAKLEQRVFKQPVSAIWEETKAYYVNRLHNPAKIANAEKDGKLKMSLCFRWYLSKSSRWANTGVPDRMQDYQIWCGPAIGSYNDFARDSPVLDPSILGHYASVVQINKHLLRGACFYMRLNQLKITNPDYAFIEEPQYIAKVML